MFFKKYKFLFTIVLVGASATQTSLIHSGDDDSGDIFFDDNMWDNLDENATPNVTRTADDLAALQVFTQLFPLNNLISGNIYLETNAINTRQLTSLPNYMMYHSDKLNEDFIFNTYLLYNETFKQNFTKTSTLLGSYLNLDTATLLEKLASNVFDVSKVPLGILNIIELAQNCKIQQRRVGSMFQFFKNHGPWSFEATVPLVYQENNFYFSDSEQSLLRIEISKLAGTTSAKSEKVDFEKYAVSDRIGFGDLKFRAGYRLISNDYVKLKAGFDTTIPTSFAFAKGLLGSNFRKNLTLPTIDLTAVYNLNPIDPDPTQAAELFELGKNLLTSFDQWLGAIVLNQSLGDFHHPTIGAFLDTKLIYNSNVACLVMGEFLYSIPKNELRFFNQIKNPADFTYAAIWAPVNAASTLPEKEAAAAVQMNFLDVNTVSFLFPTAANAHVSPGIQVQFCVAPQFEFGPYLLQIGYNFWHQTQEKIKNAVPIEPALYPLNIADCLSPAATQNKVFGRFNYNYVTPRHLWCIAVCLDQTLGSTGIGKDFNAALELSVDF